MSDKSEVANAFETDSMKISKTMYTINQSLCCDVQKCFAMCWARSVVLVSHFYRLLHLWAKRSNQGEFLQRGSWSGRSIKFYRQSMFLYAVIFTCVYFLFGSMKFLKSSNGLSKQGIEIRSDNRFWNIFSGNNSLV